MTLNFCGVHVQVHKLRFYKQKIFWNHEYESLMMVSVILCSTNDAAVCSTVHTADLFAFIWLFDAKTVGCKVMETGKPNL